MSDFSKRLESYQPLGVGARRMEPGDEVALVVRAPRILTVNGRPFGLVDGATAALLLVGLESHRLLAAVADLLEELMQASPGDIPDRLVALIGAHETVSKHITASYLSTSVAFDEVSETKPIKDSAH